MPDWDADSDRLTANLNALIEQLAARSSDRSALTLEAAKTWHARIMAGLDVPNPDYVGRFRGEAGLDSIGVRVGRHEGVHPDHVAEELESFIAHLAAAIDFLDQQIPVGGIPNGDTLNAVTDVCGWAHAEWVRIHPFANGNGRTARLWANVIATRYGLPPFVRLRPRPHGTRYAVAGISAMQGDWRPTASLFQSMLGDYLEAHTNID